MYMYLTISPAYKIHHVLQDCVNRHREQMYLLYSQKYWQKLNLAIEPKIASATVMVHVFKFVG